MGEQMEMDKNSITISGHPESIAAYFRDREEQIKRFQEEAEELRESLADYRKDCIIQNGVIDGYEAMIKELKAKVKELKESLLQQQTVNVDLAGKGGS